MKKIALYFDLQNLGIRFIPAVLERLSGWNRFLMRAYGTQLSQVREALRSNGIMPIEVVPNKPGKNAVDITIVIDAMEELCSGQTADAFGFVSEDSDFTSLCLKIRERGREVFVFAPPDAPIALQRAATTFCPLYSPDAACREARERVRELVRKFFASAQKKRTVDVFARFVSEIEPEFSPKQYGSRTMTKLLKKTNVCSLRPVLNETGDTKLYEIVEPETPALCAAD